MPHLAKPTTLHCHAWHRPRASGEDHCPLCNSICVRDGSGRIVAYSAANVPGLSSAIHDEDDA